MINNYSKAWYSKFMSLVSLDKTIEEAKFIKALIPVEEYPVILDLCCGTGRHCKELSKSGYQVLGIDVSEDAIKAAKELNLSGVEFQQRDVADLDVKANSIDAIICMWQSFGYGSDIQNEKLVKDLWAALRPGGLLLLDIYNKDFFQKSLGERTYEIAGSKVTETKEMKNDRLTISITYEGLSDRDVFDWRVFSPNEIEIYMKGLSFTHKGSYSSFLKIRTPSGDNPRAQYLFKKD